LREFFRADFTLTFEARDLQPAAMLQEQTWPFRHGAFRKGLRT
jgi:hypothetical protein